MVTWALLLTFTLSFLDYLSGVFNNSSEGQIIVSVSWAGYVISKYSSDLEIEVTSIKATWTVPEVNVSSGNGYSSMWVGIGGQTDKSLIQVGTEQDCINGKAKYHAWYEMLPNYAIKIPNLTVSPGDTVFAAITLIEPASNQWNIHLSDTTTGEAFDLNVVYNSTRSSGEWVIERPTVNNQISNLADFGTATFYDCKITVNNIEGTIGNYTNSRIQMTNQQTSQLASVSPLTVDGLSFNASYIKNG